MTPEHIKNIVAFCALMQNGEGIISKSPEYIQEKFERYCMSSAQETPWGLDNVRQSILKQWEDTWLKNGD